MLRFVVRLAIVGLLANAVWRVGFEYLAYYRFQDGVRNVIEHGGLPDPVLQQHIQSLARSFDIPVGEDEPAIHHDGEELAVEGRYEKAILLAPGYSYPWAFAWAVRAAPVARPRLDQITPLLPTR
jgi:hypothetical protein